MIHYNLAEPNDDKRRFYYQRLANEMISTDWINLVHKAKSRSYSMESRVEGFNEHTSTSFMYNIGAFITPVRTPRSLHGDCSPISTSITHRSVDGQSYQICRFEGRGRKLSNVNYCTKHKVRCCSLNHDISNDDIFQKITPKYKSVPCTDWSWKCPNSEWTCWEIS